MKEAHTHTLRHIETRDRLKIAAKIDGKRIMLKASGQWRGACIQKKKPNEKTVLDRERNEKKEKDKKKTISIFVPTSEPFNTYTFSSFRYIGSRKKRESNLYPKIEVGEY